MMVFSAKTLKQLFFFYIQQSLLLGTAGLVLFLSYPVLQGFAKGNVGPSGISFRDLLELFRAWLLALFLVTLFILLICTPMQWIVRRTGKEKYACLIGFFSGPTTVVLSLLIFSRYEINYLNYGYRMWLWYLIFGLIGLWFSFNYQKKMQKIFDRKNLGN